MLESEVNVLNNECEKLSDLKEKSRNSLQMSSFGNNPIFVEKAQVNMEKEIPTIGKSQDKKLKIKEKRYEEEKCSVFIADWRNYAIRMYWKSKIRRGYYWGNY
ncbi:hypothetical protein [Ruminococcus sp. SR1/5]|uniref:hypothetical protein n=1 Tax=Ruminococcus sp. SR1/5 TaxID=657323 RepID=UPI00274292EE|nr:hypothetical protein [Ruminococcus sp. SR1/5]